MAKSVNLPAPYAGVNEKVPKAAIASPYCEELLNFNVTQAGISLRNGNSKFSLMNQGATGTYPYIFAKNGNSKLFIYAYDFTLNKNVIYDAESGSIVFTHGTAGNFVAYSSTEFNQYTYIFSPGGAVTGFVYDGANWGAIGYTGSSFQPAGSAVYRSRHYIIQYNEAAYWYSEIEARSGALTKIDLSGVVSEKCYLMDIAPVTLSDNITTSFMLAFVFSTGEILFYDGSYPDSSDWTLRGKVKISQPITFQSHITYQGDSLLFCDNGVISIRDLFLKGSEQAASLTVNTDINQTWQDLIQLLRVVLSQPTGYLNGIYMRGVWDTKTNRIIVQLPYYPDSSNGFGYNLGGFFFVFNTIQQSWMFHKTIGSSITFHSVAGTSTLLEIIYYKNKVLSLSYGTSKIIVYEKEGATGFTDRSPDDAADVAYDYDFLSAPIPFPKTAVYEATQIEPIMESDLYAETNWNFVADFGRQTSGNQQTNALTTSVAKPSVNVGMQNITFVQVKMSGTTTTGKTVGLDLYSYNVWYDSGQEGSR